MSTASIDLPFNMRAALALADALALGLTLFRPVTQYTEEVYEDDGQGGEWCKVVQSPNVFVFPLTGASPFQLGAWVERDEGESCLHVRALGCDIELWFVSRRQAMRC